MKSLAAMFTLTVGGTFSSCIDSWTWGWCGPCLRFCQLTWGKIFWRGMSVYMCKQPVWVTDLETFFASHSFSLLVCNAVNSSAAFSSIHFWQSMSSTSKDCRSSHSALYMMEWLLVPTWWLSERYRWASGMDSGGGRRSGGKTMITGDLLHSGLRRYLSCWLIFVHLPSSSTRNLSSFSAFSFPADNNYKRYIQMMFFFQGPFHIFITFSTITFINEQQVPGIMHDEFLR